MPDSLRKEGTVDTSLLKRALTAEAEVERLRSVLATELARWRDQTNQLHGLVEEREFEIERLRDALRTIANHGSDADRFWAEEALKS